METYSNKRVPPNTLKSNRLGGCQNGHVLYESKVSLAVWDSHTGFHKDSSLFGYTTASLWRLVVAASVGNCLPDDTGSYPRRYDSSGLGNYRRNTNFLWIRQLNECKCWLTFPATVICCSEQLAKRKQAVTEFSCLDSLLTGAQK